MAAFVSLLVRVVVAARSPVVSTDEDVARYREVVHAMLAESQADPLWGVPVESGEGDAAPPAHIAATTTILLAIAYHESGLREGVRRCTEARGKAKYAGLFQLAPGWAWQGNSRDEICASDRLQARLALGILKSYRDRNAATAPAFWLNGFASGDGGHTTPEARGMRELWARFSRQSGLQIDAVSRAAPVWRPAAVLPWNQPSLKRN